MSGEFKLEMAIAKAMGNKDYKLAIEYYEQLHEKRNDTHSLHGIASCYKKIGNPEKAIKYAKESLLLDENNFESLKLLAGIYHGKGQYSEVYSHVVKAIDVGNSITEKSIPFYLSWILKILSIFPKFKNTEESLRKSLQHNDEWIDWAKEFKQRYEHQNWSKH